jgi:AbrB family looped-hinge helix DNA binding protein
VAQGGLITLPREIRKKLGIKAGTTLVVQEKGGKIVLMPAALTPVEIYSDEEIRGWLVEDKITDSERKRILRKAGPR